MEKIIITQKKSVINRPLRQKRTIEALGLGRINKQVEKQLTDSIRGMIATVSHLVEVKTVKK